MLQLRVQDFGAWKRKDHTRHAAEGRSMAAQISEGDTATGSGADEGRPCTGCAYKPGALATCQSWQSMAPGTAPLTFTTIMNLDYLFSAVFQTWQAAVTFYSQNSPTTLEVTHHRV